MSWVCFYLQASVDFDAPHFIFLILLRQNHWDPHPCLWHRNSHDCHCWHGTGAPANPQPASCCRPHCQLPAQLQRQHIGMTHATSTETNRLSWSSCQVTVQWIYIIKSTISLMAELPEDTRHSLCFSDHCFVLLVNQIIRGPVALLSKSTAGQCGMLSHSRELSTATCPRHPLRMCSASLCAWTCACTCTCMYLRVRFEFSYYCYYY